MKHIRLLCLFIAAGIIGCGGGGGSPTGGNGGGSTDGITGISVLQCPSPSVQVGKTMTCSGGTVLGNGTFDHGVTLAVNGITNGNTTVGTISSSLVFGAPATIPSPATVTLTATANGAPSQKTSFAITITATSPPPPPVPVTSSAVSSITNSAFIFLASPGATTVKLAGSGFASTDTQVMSKKHTPHKPSVREFRGVGYWRRVRLGQFPSRFSHGQ